MRSIQIHYLSSAWFFYLLFPAHAAGSAIISTLARIRTLLRWIAMYSQVSTSLPALATRLSSRKFEAFCVYSESEHLISPLRAESVQEIPFPVFVQIYFDRKKQEKQPLRSEGMSSRLLFRHKLTQCETEAMTMTIIN